MKPQSRDRRAPASLIQTLDTTEAALSHRRIHSETRSSDRVDGLDRLVGADAKVTQKLAKVLALSLRE